MKDNIFNKRGARFEATVDLNKKKGHRGNISSCAKNEDIIFQGNSIIISNMREKAIKTNGCKLLLDALKLIGVIECNRVPYYRSIFQPGPD
jgi:hypothetical protein